MPSTARFCATITFDTRPRRAVWAGNRQLGMAGTTNAAIEIGCYKHIIGPKLRARSLLAKRSETAIAVTVLSRVIRITEHTHRYRS